MDTFWDTYNLIYCQQRPSFMTIIQDTAFYLMCNECIRVYYSPSEIMIASDPDYKHKCNSIPLWAEYSLI